MSGRGGPIRLGLVGCGRVAEAGYAPAAAALAGVEIAALADPLAERRRRVGDRIAAARRGARPSTHGSLAAMLEASRLDGLIVASPVAEHLAHAELAAAAGLPCLVEKPPATALAGARLLAALQPAPWIGFNRRFQHGPSLLASLPEGGFDLTLEIRYRRASWDPVAVEDEALLDLGPHLIDLAMFLTCSAGAEVLAASHSRDRLELELETRRGRATIRGAADRAYAERVAVHDRAGRRVVSSVQGGPGRALLTRLPGAELPLVASLRDQLAEFAGTIRGEPGELLATAEEGVGVMRVIERVRERTRQAPVAPAALAASG